MQLEFLIFDAIDDGAPVGVESGRVLRYIDSAPSNMVPQPNSRRGIVGAAGLSWTGADQAPVALVDALYAADLRPRPAKVTGLLLVRGADSVMALLTVETPRAIKIECDQPPGDWESHPKAGTSLRRAPIESDGKPLWSLDPALLALRILG